MKIISQILSIFLTIALCNAQTKNVIIFLGDGMGVSTVTAARIYSQQKYKTEKLSFENFSNLALVDVKGSDALIPDSASTMSAIICGTQTKRGYICLNPDANLKNFKQNTPVSLLSKAEEAGMKTGIVTTTSITHATPAVAYAHSLSRSWENDTKIPSKARRAGAKDIAYQLVNYAYGDGIDFIAGGGRQEFQRNDQEDPEYLYKNGLRDDAKDLIYFWKRKYPQGSYVWSQKDFLSLNPTKTSHVLALFEPNHMQFEHLREEDPAGEPDLKTMTEKALQFLRQDSNNSYFLIVEGGRIDHAHHDNTAKIALEETVAFANAIDYASKNVNLKETLILVTADHSHPFVFSGDVAPDESIFDYIIDQQDRHTNRFTPLAYINGPGAYFHRKKYNKDPKSYNYRSNSLVPRSSALHSGEDVALYAEGAGSERFSGTMEQKDIYILINKALNF